MKKLKDYIMQRIIIKQEKYYELKVLQVSPTGSFIKIQDSGGNSRWIHRDEIDDCEIVEVLGNIIKYEG